MQGVAPGTPPASGNYRRWPDVRPALLALACARAGLSGPETSRGHRDSKNDAHHQRDLRKSHARRLDGGRIISFVPYTESMGSEAWLTISAWPLIQLSPLIVVGYLLLRQPVNLMIGMERPMLRRFVTVIAALVACRLFLSLPS
jgi:hypothetical protein